MSTKDRKLIEKENRRESILSAAESVMTTYGIHGLNIDLIANETQLAKGTIYLYFKSKEEILSVLSIKARKLLYKEFQKIEKSDISPIEKIKDLVKANYQFYKKSPLYYDLVSLYEVNNTLTETEEMHAVGIHDPNTYCELKDLIRDNLDALNRVRKRTISGFGGIVSPALALQQ